ncbi:MAG: class I SAM-dependent rRNA methyltransferase [Chitinispirillaceae bacterium]
MSTDIEERMILKVFLKKGKDKLVRMGNPWVFSGAVARTEGEYGRKRLCGVYDHRGESVGTGYFNSKSAIRVRMLTRKGDFTVHDLGSRIKEAVLRRAGLLSDHTDSCRLVNSEGDFLPGLVVDKYGEGLCIQIGTAGMECWRSDIVDTLVRELSPAFIYERSDTDSRRREGLEESGGVLKGQLPSPLIINEEGVKFLVDLASGQKTGFFFDQRMNRSLLRFYSSGKCACDCFSYSGGFAVNALKGGARKVQAVDVSKSAGEWVATNAGLNGFDRSVEFVCADVFRYLRESQESFSLLVLDPPKFARHPGEVDRAARGYKDINMVGLRRLEPGGVLFTFSCSSAVEPYLFRQILFSAAADAGRSVQLLHVLSAGPDHPVNIAHREGEYLKGLVLRVVGD